MLIHNAENASPTSVTKRRYITPLTLLVIISFIIGFALTRTTSFKRESASLNLTVDERTETSITWGWIDQSTDETSFELYRVSGELIASIPSTSVQETGGKYTYQESELSPNVAYTRLIQPYNGLTKGTASAHETAYTLANIAQSPSITESNFADVTIALSSDTSNPATTEYAIFESTTSQYLQTDRTLKSTPVWQTLAGWRGGNGLTVTGLKENTTYSFGIKARNGDDIETALSLVASTKTAQLTPPPTPSPTPSPSPPPSTPSPIASVAVVSATSQPEMKSAEPVPSTVPFTTFVRREIRLETPYQLLLPIGVFIIAVPFFWRLILRGYQLVLIIGQLSLMLPFLAISLVRKRKSWGIVHNSTTNKPIPLATVSIYSQDAYGKLVQRTLTNRWGEFGFSIPSGRYTLSVARMGYDFPSLEEALVLEKRPDKVLRLYGTPRELSPERARQVRTSLQWIGLLMSLFFFLRDTTLLNAFFISLYLALVVRDYAQYNRMKFAVREYKLSV